MVGDGYPIFSIRADECACLTPKEIWRNYRIWYLKDHGLNAFREYVRRQRCDTCSGDSFRWYRDKPFDLVAFDDYDVLDAEEIREFYEDESEVPSWAAVPQTIRGGGR